MSTNASLKPMTVYGEGGINPAKVKIILRELAIPFETTHVLLADIKKPAYAAINPNGRLPALHDPNTGITLWESGAIVEYIIERYDTEHKLSFPAGSPEAARARQWSYFQASGQGPYYGQAAWFKWFSPEVDRFAIDRYKEQSERVCGVLNDFLGLRKEKGEGGADGPWLVGDKCSYADLSFIMWQNVIAMALADEGYSIDKYPHLKAWLDKMLAREAVGYIVARSGKLE